MGESISIWRTISWCFYINLFRNEQGESRRSEDYYAKEFVETIVAIPSKVSDHFQNEWEDIKVYQANSWADMKAQFAKNKEQVINLFKKD